MVYQADPGSACGHSNAPEGILITTTYSVLVLAPEESNWVWAFVFYGQAQKSNNFGLFNAKCIWDI